MILGIWGEVLLERRVCIPEKAGKVWKHKARVLWRVSGHLTSPRGMMSTLREGAEGPGEHRGDLGGEARASGRLGVGWPQRSQ